jgi:hypothetical protein
VLKAGGDMEIIEPEVIIVERLIPGAYSGFFLEKDLVGCKINYGLIVCKEGVVVEEVCRK